MFYKTTKNEGINISTENKRNQEGWIETKKKMQLNFEEMRI